jgi:hypothetical protein
MHRESDFDFQREKIPEKGFAFYNEGFEQFSAIFGKLENCVLYNTKIVFLKKFLFLEFSVHFFCNPRRPIFSIFKKFLENLNI